MTAGAACAIPVLVLPQPEDPLLTITIHLSLIVLFGLALAFHLAPLADDPWFTGIEVGVAGRRALTWIVVIVAVTGAAGLVTIATSAAFRYDASLQFLQLLSALDITWAATAIVLGARRRFGGPVAVWFGMGLGIVSVWAIWRYLVVVGFTPAGGWLVDGAELMLLVLPYDMATALVAVIVFSLGVRAPEAAPGI
jgi:hypothetical protein